MEVSISAGTQASSIMNARPHFNVSWDNVSITSDGKSKNDKNMYRLEQSSGYLEAGTMTMVLAPPGHGATTMQKMVAGRLPLAEGTVRYNGRTAAENYQAQIDMRKSIGYLEQTDVHIPLLTVQETLEFIQSINCRVPDDNRVNEVVQAQQLQRALNTIVGNNAIRGTSFGEKRRCSIAEVQLSDASIIALDQYTTGQDSNVAIEITKFLKGWVSKTGATLICSIQQPTPEIISLYDNIIVLNESKVVFHGPLPIVDDFFQSMGFICPPDMDILDYVISVVSDSTSAFLNSAQLQNKETKLHDQVIEQWQNCTDLAADVKEGDWEWLLRGNVNRHVYYDEEQTTSIPLPVPSTPCFTSTQMKHFYEATALHTIIKTFLAEETQPQKLYVYQNCFPVGYNHSQFSLFSMILARQAKLSIRNKTQYIPRIVQMIVISLIGLSLFYQVKMDSYYERVCEFSFLMNMLTYISISELPTAVNSALVVYKQLNNNCYPVALYVMSSILCNIPLLFIESAVLVSVVYWGADNYQDVGSYFLTLVIVFLTGMTANVYFHMLSTVNNSELTATQIASPTIGTLFQNSGQFVTLPNIPDFMVWLFWLSPWSWALRALANIEFNSSKYNSRIQPNGVKWGVSILKNFDFYTDREWIWYCIIYLVGLCCVMMQNQMRLMSRPYFEQSRGTTRYSDGAVATKLSIKKSMTEELGVTPQTLMFHNIKYTVQVPKDGHMEDKVLLNNINGVCLPGTLTALMGSSGAGKTTLLDVLAGQKTQGTIEGDIMINGQPVDAVLRAKVCGFVEQIDDQCAELTVYETLLFSANLRLPTSVTMDLKQRLIEEILTLQDMYQFKDKLIGDVVQPSLSPSQMKRVTIGVELVANPKILFLDEPTSNLDSKSALLVMNVVKRIAEAGRTVVVCLHQPSTELFYYFDNLVLLIPGGKQVFAGALGYRAEDFVKYLSAIPGQVKKQNKENPADWMLKALNTLSTLSVDIETNTKMLQQQHQAILQHFEQSAHYNELLQNVGSITMESQAITANTPTFQKQFAQLFKRTWTATMRNRKAIIGRLISSVLLGVVYGCIYFDLKPTTQTKTLNAISARANSVSFNAIVHGITCASGFKQIRSYIYKEQVYGFYKGYMFIASVFVCELLLCMLDSFFFQIPLYYMSGFDMDAGQFFRYYFTVTIVNMATIGSSLLFCCMFSSHALIGSITSLYNTLCVLFAGLTITYANAREGWRFMYYVSIFGRSTEAIAMSQFENASGQITILVGETTVTVTVKQYVSIYMGYEYGGYWEAMAVLLTWMVFFFLTTGIVISLVLHRNK